MLVRFKHLFSALSLLCCFIGSGCSTDPRVKEQKFMDQANRDFQRGKYPEAMISYGRAIQIAPSSVDAHYKLAQTFMKMGSWASAYQELSKTVELDAKNWPAQLDLARIQLAGGRANEARDRARLILRDDPKNADAQMILSDADVTLGNLMDARQEAEAAIAMAPNRSDLYLNFGHVQVRQQDLPGAEESFKKAQSLDPKECFRGSRSASFIYSNTNAWQDARQTQLVTAIQVAPKDVAARGALAALYFSQGQESQGEKVLTGCSGAAQGRSQRLQAFGRIVSYSRTIRQSAFGIFSPGGQTYRRRFCSDKTLHSASHPE